MLDTTLTVSPRVSSASGLMAKSHPKSFFESCHQDSGYAKTYIYGGSHYIVLQAMCLADGWLLFELVDRKDYGEAVS